MAPAEARIAVVAVATSVIAADGLTKRYPPDVTALAGVTFAVAPGEFVAVLGPSGAGKTTLFRCLTGLTRPDRGTIRIDGRDVWASSRELSQARRSVALIFQQFNLIRRLTALENVLVGRLAHVPTWRVLARRFTRADRQLALGCLDTVGLLDKAAVRADQLSGGQQQRVAIARALAQRAKVILADEPVASLDPESSATVLQSLRSAVPPASRSSPAFTRSTSPAPTPIASWPCATVTSYRMRRPIGSTSARSSRSTSAPASGAADEHPGPHARGRRRVGRRRPRLRRARPHPAHQAAGVGAR